jgi:hypothetical protein
MARRLFHGSLVLVAMLAPASAGSNGEALRPPMTWRSWNQFAQFINTSIIQKMVRASCVCPLVCPCECACALQLRLLVVVWA